MTLDLDAVLDALAPGATAHAVWPLHAGRALPLRLARFDAQACEAAPFARRGIALPPALALAGPARQAAFLHGRLCAQLAARDLGLPDTAPTIGADGAPTWPAGVTGSITHTAELAAAAALPAGAWRGIGLDLEPIARGDAADALRGSAVQNDEAALLAGLRGHAPLDVLLTLAFSAKESFYKGVYGAVGRFFDFDALRLRAVAPDARTLTFTVTRDLCPAWPADAVVEVDYAVGREAVLTAFHW